MRISVFPVVNTILFPRSRIPMRVAEPVHCALINDAMARDQRIGIIQPRGNIDPQPLYEVGCLGRIEQFAVLPEGHFDMIVIGLTRFRIISELEVATSFRQVEATVEEFGDDRAPEPLPADTRAAILGELHYFGGRLGNPIDLTPLEQWKDEDLVNYLSWVVPLDIAAKQALIEAPAIADRAALVLEYMRFIHAQEARGGQDGQRMQ